MRCDILYVFGDENSMRRMGVNLDTRIHNKSIFFYFSTDNEELRLCYLKDTSTDSSQPKQGASENPGSGKTPQVDLIPAAGQPGAELLSPQAEKAPGTSGTPGTPRTPGTPGTQGTPVPQPRKKLNLIPKTQDSASSDST